MEWISCSHCKRTILQCPNLKQSSGIFFTLRLLQTLHSTAKERHPMAQVTFMLDKGRRHAQGRRRGKAHCSSSSQLTSVGWTGRSTRAGQGAAQGATKHFGKQALPGSQRAELRSFLTVKLPRREAERYSHCLRSCMPSLVFVCVCVYFSETFFLCTPGNWLDVSSGLLMEQGLTPGS